MREHDHLDELVQTHARLLDSLVQVGDAQMREPSLLPGWTRDMLVAHLRFGAEAAIRGVQGVIDGSGTAMYPGGEDQRDAEIGSGSGRPASELIADLAAACQQLESLLRDLPDAAWDGQVRTRRGFVAVREVLLQRWLDAEVHHVDLDLGYSKDRWPESLIDAYLPGVIGLVPALRRRPDADLTVAGSWHFHRTDGAGEWSVYARDEQVAISAGHEKCDCAVRGSGAALLTFLLGRGADDIELIGDQAKAAAVKAAFPGP